jgi:hypothetical protein
MTLHPELIAMLKRMDPEELVKAAPTATTLTLQLGEGRIDPKEMALGGAHKLRIEFCTNFTADEVDASLLWLEEHGL